MLFADGRDACFCFGGAVVYSTASVRVDNFVFLADFCHELKLMKDGTPSVACSTKETTRTRLEPLPRDLHSRSDLPNMAKGLTR